MKRLWAIAITLLVPAFTWAQCAMCRTQVKNNVSNGETTLAEGLNNGIMFLFFTPYVVLFIVIVLWFKFSKVNEGKISLIERIKSQMPKMS